MTTTLRNLKTAEAVAEHQPTEQVAERKYPWVHALRELLADLVSDRVALVGAVGFLLFLLMAITAPVIASQYTKQNLALRLSAPTLVVNDQFNYHYALGADQLGRPILDRIIYGSRVSLQVGLIVVAFTGLFGTVLGLMAGYFGGKVDTLIMRWVDIQTAFPGLLVALTILIMLGPNLTNMMIALMINGWMIFARIVRGVTLSLREEVFVKAARVIGASDMRIVFHHLLPNLISPILTIAVMELARIILAEAALSFLGMGIQPPESSWGLMLADGRDYMTQAWWLVTFPGVAIALTVLFINMVAGWLRSVSDPQQRFKKFGKEA
jgi:ABC-type dipeptide/oligopeptide/nickel transport system permease subunit